MTAAPQLAVALDLPERDAALDMAARLRGIAPWVKVGMELFTLCGPSVLERLKDMGFHVFLDLKFHDIPNTVARAVGAAARGGADMITLHVQGGRRMCEAARDAADALRSGGERAPLLFGVTVLTSFGPGEMPGIATDPPTFALELAREAALWGLDGVVCSAREAASIKAAAPALSCLCPGIRPEGDAPDDQRRVMTPASAVLAGADYLVVGRPITRSGNPAEAARRILAEMRLENVQAGSANMS